MSMYSDNPIHNVVEHQIKGGIRLCYENEHYSSALKLLYCGIDLMAFLSLPADQNDVTKSDFVKWVEEFIKLPGDNQLTGEELRAARNQILHTHRPHQVLNENDKRRPIGYASKSKLIDRTMDIPSENETKVMVPVEHLMEAFFEGINKFLIDVYQNPQQAQIVEQRIKLLLHNMPEPR